MGATKTNPFGKVKRKQNKKIEVYGEGENVRHWLYVEDTVEAILKVVEVGLGNDIYNLGSGDYLTNNETANKLLEAGATVSAYDPVAMEEGKRILGDKITFAKDEYGACIDADALIVVTEWSEFRLPNFKVLEKLLKNKLIFDGRNIFDIEELNDLGFTYFPIGRNPIIN